MVDKKPETTSRRDFMRVASVGAVAAGATMIAKAPAEAATLEKPSGGYRETEHVQAYLATCRF